MSGNHARLDPPSAAAVEATSRTVFYFLLLLLLRRLDGNLGRSIHITIWPESILLYPVKSCFSDTHREREKDRIYIRIDRRAHTLRVAR